jgi:hypothetical protein
MSATETMDRVTAIVQGAVARKRAAGRTLAFIENELAVLRIEPRTASLQHYLLGVQRALKEEQAAAMHLIADVASLRTETAK